MSRDDGRALVDGERQADYGEPVAHMGNVARAWSGVLGYTVTPRQVVLCLVALKLVREGHKHNADNIDDAHGYLEILGRIEEAGWKSTTLPNTTLAAVNSVEPT